MPKFINTLFMLLLGIALSAQITDPVATEVWEPVPRAVESPANGAPSDAIILFDGSDLDEWKSRYKDAPAGWVINKDGSVTVLPGAGDIITKQGFGDVQLHIEFRIPTEVEGEGQDKGNSGVFLQGRYEVQVLDSYKSKTYSNGQAGAIYKQSIPLVNACRPPATWQEYDIIYTAPRFNEDGIKISSAYITVLQNGVLIQNHFEIKGTTEYIGLPKNIAHGEDGVILQDHGNKVSYRNIWLRKL